MNLVAFVIEAGRIHQQIYAQAKGLLSLLATSWDNGHAPATDGIATKRAKKVITIIKDRTSIIEGDAFEPRLPG